MFPKLNYFGENDELLKTIILEKVSHIIRNSQKASTSRLSAIRYTSQKSLKSYHTLKTEHFSLATGQRKSEQCV